jgi:hypothetical protein
MSGDTVPSDAAGTGEFQQITVCRRPIFILGAPRSGTSILARALGAHPDLWYSTESHLLWGLYGSNRADRVYEHARSRPNALIRREAVSRSSFLAHLGVGINSLLMSLSGGRRWIEKTPINTLMADVIAEMFPEAQFVHLVRDGRNVVHSMAQFLKSRPDDVRARAEDRSYIRRWEDFRQASATWSRYVEAGAEFCARHPDRCISTTLEAIVADPSGQFRDLLRFLRAASDSTAAEYFRSNRVNSSFGNDRAGDGGGRQPRAWTDWSLEQRRVFLDEAGSSLVTAGYTTLADLDALRTEVSRGASELGLHSRTDEAP